MAITVPPRGRQAPARRLFAEPLAVKVPEITAWFWVVKILTTAAGEATSDALKTLGNIKGGAIEVALFLIGIALQFRSRRYTAVAYWFLAGAIATFGTGVADFMHLDLGIPYAGTSVLWAVVLAAVFWLWNRSEGTLSIHSITTTRRELYYWATVFATFALGTALGDFTASELGLGYFASAILFTAVILVPAFAYRWLSFNSIAAFWFAYIVTRPLGASYADYISKPLSWSGIGFGDAPTAILLGLAIVVCVAYLAVARPDAPLTVPTAREPPWADDSPRPGGGPSGRGAHDGSGAPDAPGAPSAAAGGRGAARRHLGGWPPRQPASPPLGGSGHRRAPDPPAAPRRPRQQAGGEGTVRPRTPMPAVPPVPPRTGATPPRPAAPPVRPRRPVAVPPPPGGERGDSAGATENAAQNDPLLRDLLAWGLVEPKQPADDGATWHLADQTRHRLDDLTTGTRDHGSHLVYFDRVCAGCRRRQMTRQHGGAYVCDACLARAEAPTPARAERPPRPPRPPGTARGRRG